MTRNYVSLGSAAQITQAMTQSNISQNVEWSNYWFHWHCDKLCTFWQHIAKKSAETLPVSMSQCVKVFESVFLSTSGQGDTNRSLASTSGKLQVFVDENWKIAPKRARAIVLHECFWPLTLMAVTIKRVWTYEVVWAANNASVADDESVEDTTDSNVVNNDKDSSPPSMKSEKGWPKLLTTLARQICDFSLGLSRCPNVRPLLPHYFWAHSSREGGKVEWSEPKGVGKLGLRMQVFSSSECLNEQAKTTLTSGGATSRRPRHPR